MHYWRLIMALIEHRPGFAYGVGLNELNEEMKGDAVIRTVPDETFEAEGQTVEFKLDKVDSYSELQQSLGLSVEANASFGFGRGSAKFNWAESSNFSSYSIYLLATTTVKNAFRQMQDVHLTDNAVRAIINDSSLFRDRFGDSFIRGLLTGGEFVALLEITTRDEEEKRDISAEVDAGGIGGSWNVSAQFNQNIKSITEDKSLKVRTFQVGGNDTDAPLTADAIVERSSNFATQVEGARAAPFMAGTMEYITTTNYPDEAERIELEIARQTMFAVAERRAELMTWINDIEYVLLNQEQFDEINVDELNEARRVIREAIVADTQAVRQCARNPNTCQAPPVLDLPEVRLPTRRGRAIEPPQPRPPLIRLGDWARWSELAGEIQYKPVLKPSSFKFIERVSPEVIVGRVQQ